MANQMAASIYGINSNARGTAQGVIMSFPSQNITIQPPGSTTTFNGVTMNSVIQLIPGGTVVTQKQFFSSATVATLVTAANA